MPNWFPKAHPLEPESAYQRKLQLAEYSHVNYINQISNYYRGFLFGHPIAMKAGRPGASPGDEPVKVDPFYSQLKEDCDGNGTDLQEFLGDRFVEAFVSSQTVWAVMFPPRDATEELNRAAWETLGLGNAKLKKFEPEAIRNWETDAKGELLWISLCDVEKRQESIADSRGVTTETYYVFTREALLVYRVRWEHIPPNDNLELEPADTLEHSFERVPVVWMRLNPGDWLCNQLLAPQISNWHARAQAAWVAYRIATSVPILKSNEKELAGMFVHGDLLKIGKDDGFEFSTPPAEHYDMLSGQIKSTKDELYREANLNFLSLENNSYQLIRSGVSRMIDADSGHIRLKGYGAIVREAAERTYSLISQGRGENLTWAAQGFEHLDSQDLSELVAVAEKLAKTPIQSQKFNAEFQKRIALQALRDLDETTRETIVREIDRAGLAQPTTTGPEAKAEEQPQQDDKEAKPSNHARPSLPS